MLTVKRYFPLDHQHKGAVLGNGYTGEMIWGSGNILNISLGCANLWDHRGGMEWKKHQTFQAIRKHLEIGDLAKVNKLFASENIGAVRRPSLIPGGRLVIILPPNTELLYFKQFIEHGETCIIYNHNGNEKNLKFHADMTMDSALACTGLTDDMKLQLIPARQLCRENANYPERDRDEMEQRGFPEPEFFTCADGEAFFQKMPADSSYAMLYRRVNKTLTIAFCRGIETDFESVAAESVRGVGNGGMGPPSYDGWWLFLQR